MVLEYNLNNMKTTIILIIGALLSSCQQTSIITDTTNIGKFKFELVQKNDQTLLRTILNKTKVEHELKLAPPCYFLRKKGEIQTFSYPDVDIENVIIIIGDIANYEDKENYEVDSSKVCGKKIQGLIIKNGNVILTGKTISGGLSCKDNGLDEKDFWDFAHD